MKKYIPLLIAFLLVAWPVFSLSTTLTSQGGTGSTTPSGIQYGDNGATSHLNTVKVGSGCTFSAGTLSCAGTGATFGQGWEFSNGFLTPTTTVKVNILQASSTVFSANQGYFGSTGTTTIGIDGAISTPSYIANASSTVSATLHARAFMVPNSISGGGGYLVTDTSGNTYDVLDLNANNDLHLIPNFTGSNTYIGFNNSSTLNFGQSCCGGSLPAGIIFNTLGATTLQTSGTTGINLSNTGVISFPRLTSNGFLKTGSGNGTVSVDTTSYLSGTVGVANGGTGRATLTSGQLIYGNGTGIVGSVATTSVSCSGSATCTSFTAIGAAPITISATGLATSTADWIVYRDAGTTKVLDTISNTIVKTGTFDQVMNYIVNVSTSTSPARVNTVIRSGTYDCNASIVLNGGGSRFGPDLIFTGSASSTTIVVNTAKCFDLRNQATIDMEHLAFAFAANANTAFFASTTAGSTVQSSVRESIFNDINGFSTTTGHTGYIFDFIDDFRNNYYHIMGDQVGNCWRSTNNYTNAQFINGDSHFNGFNFCEINNTGVGVAWTINGASGIVNQDIFDDINGISNDSSPSNDIFFKVTSGQSITVRNMNVEQFGTTTQVLGTSSLTSHNNSFSSNKYILSKGSATVRAAIAEFDTNSYNNTFSCSRIDTLSGANVWMMYDKNSVATVGYKEPNIFQGVDGGTCEISGSATEIFNNATSSTIVRRVYDNVNGTNQTWNNLIEDGTNLIFNLQQGVKQTGYTFEQWSSNALRWKNGALNAGTENMTLLDTGSLGIGSTTPTAKLAIHANNGETNRNLFMIASSTASATTTVFTVDNQGRVFAPVTTSSGSAQTGYWCYDANGQLIRDTVVCIVSAKKFKKDILPLDVGLDDLMKLRPVSYYYKDSNFGSTQQMGFIADEVASSSSRLNTMLVAYDSEGAVHGFNYNTVTALITKSIQDFYGQFQKLVARVSGLEAKIDKQQKQIDTLTARLNKLEKK